jgi:hypothetical protein
LVGLDVEVVSAASPLVQAVYLALSYFIATHLGKSMSETNGPGDVDVSTWFSQPEAPMQDPVFWLWFGVALLFVISGWWSALNDGNISPFHPIAWFLFGCGGIATLVLFPLNRPMGWLSLTYVIAAALSLYMPNYCAKSWWKRLQVA